MRQNDLVDLPHRLAVFPLLLAAQPLERSGSGGLHVPRVLDRRQPLDRQEALRGHREHEIPATAVEGAEVPGVLLKEGVPPPGEAGPPGEDPAVADEFAVGVNVLLPGLADAEGHVRRQHLRHPPPEHLPLLPQLARGIGNAGPGAVLARDVLLRALLREYADVVRVEREVHAHLGRVLLERIVVYLVLVRGGSREVIAPSLAAPLAAVIPLRRAEEPAGVRIVEAHVGDTHVSAELSQVVGGLRAHLIERPAAYPLLPARVLQGGPVILRVLLNEARERRHGIE